MARTGAVTRPAEISGIPLSFGIRHSDFVIY
jgi:hypothetical protein